MGDISGRSLNELNPPLICEPRAVSFAHAISVFDHASRMPIWPQRTNSLPLYYLGLCARTHFPVVVVVAWLQSLCHSVVRRPLYYLSQSLKYVVDRILGSAPLCRASWPGAVVTKSYSVAHGIGRKSCFVNYGTVSIDRHKKCYGDQWYGRRQN